eukprot:2674648-Amphidinium_carterae.1
MNKRNALITFLELRILLRKDCPQSFVLVFDLPKVHLHSARGPAQSGAVTCYSCRGMRAVVACSQSCLHSMPPSSTVELLHVNPGPMLRPSTHIKVLKQCWSVRHGCGASIRVCSTRERCCTEGSTKRCAPLLVVKDVWAGGLPHVGTYYYLLQSSWSVFSVNDLHLVPGRSAR